MKNNEQAAGNVISLYLVSHTHYYLFVFFRRDVILKKNKKRN